MPSAVLSAKTTKYIMILGIGIAVIIITILKKRNEDQLNKINNYGNNGTAKNVCSNCGLNLSENAVICPKCGTKVKKE